MRERLALLAAVLTSLMVLGMSFLLASTLDSSGVAAASNDPGKSSDEGEEARFARGRQLFFTEGCSGCHSVAGEGNPRGPLDGVASRRNREQLRDFAFGTGSASETLPRRVVIAKSVYAELAEEDREALISFLESLH